MNAVMKTDNSRLEIGKIIERVREVLIDWGQYEAVGHDAGYIREGLLGDLIDGANRAPRGEFGPSVPIGVYTPRHVARMSRAMALLKEDHARHHRAVWLRYVRAYRRGPGAVERVAHEADDGLRAGEMSVSVSRYRHILCEGVRHVATYWRDA